MKVEVHIHQVDKIIAVHQKVEVVKVEESINLQKTNKLLQFFMKVGIF